MHPALRRTLASLAAWIAGATVAITVGILALSAIGDGWAASAAPRPVQANGGGQVLGSPGTPAPTVASTGARTSAGTGPATTRVGTLIGRGGTVEAQCSGSVAYLRSWSPDQAYQADEVHRGPGRVVSVKFSAPGRESTLRVRCVEGLPQLDTSWSGDDGGTHE